MTLMTYKAEQDGVLTEVLPAEQQECEEQLEAYYRSGCATPMEIARAVVNYRHEYHVTQLALSERIGVTPGTLCHYESLVRSLIPGLARAVENGTLRFKEARALAQLPADRQASFGEPFVLGELSSAYVERLVIAAKRSPDLSVWELVNRLMAVENGTLRFKEARALAQLPDGQSPREEKPQAEAQSHPAAAFDSAPLKQQVLDLAGDLAGLQERPVREIERLSLVRTLEILQAWVEQVLVDLGNGAKAPAAPGGRPQVGA